MADTIILTNISGSSISIDDLGIFLEDNESLDLLENFTSKEILDSEDLSIEYDNNNISFELNTSSITYDELREYFEPLTEQKHESLDSLKHNLSEPAYFETTKNLEQKTYLITYYNDNTKTSKIREEEIIRDVDGKTSQIVLRQYDVNGDIYKTEIQTLNRSIEGTISSIEVTNV